MARPFDPSENVAAEVFSGFPDEVQEDSMFQELFEHLFDKGNNWVEAHEWHDALDAYLRDEYDLDLDYFFDWDDWRDNYDAA